MFFRRFLLLFLCLATAAFAEPSQAQRDLQAIVSKQQRLFARAVEQGDRLDEDDFKQKVQELAYDYDYYIKKYPDVAAGYATYGYFLGKVDMNRQSIAMLLKANQLNPNEPFVKNQIGCYIAEDGKPLEAVNYFLAAIKLDPKEPLYHYQLGLLLHTARDDFLKSGEWTKASVDKAMFEAFKAAAEYGPNRIEFTYRYCEAFYDLEKPDWPEALRQWEQLEARVKPGVEQQTIRLHRANILLKQSKVKEARELLATVSEATLNEQKEKLIAQLPENAKK